jgi:glucose-6-phosphate isomerase
LAIIREVSIEEIASAVGTPEEVEMVFKLLEHAAANVDHPIKKIPVDPPFRSLYQYSIGAM